MSAARLAIGAFGAGGVVYMFVVLMGGDADSDDGAFDD
jgi:hypothetical protein